MKIIVVSGGFDPIHSGHIAYLSSAKELGDKLIVALNSDKWLKNKKGFAFMSFKERKIVLEAINVVDSVKSFEDDELGSCKNALEEIKKEYKDQKIIFANGGDRNQSNIPEMEVQDIDFVFGIGGNDKKNSSSEMMKRFITLEKKKEKIYE
tara:strand:- start:1406 stop:1858 length:453 start_codon:yes stop_codon:yes gene_type:complete